MVKLINKNYCKIIITVIMNKDTLNCIISSSDGIPLLSFSHSKNNSEANENNITRLAVTMNSFLPG